MGQTESRVFDGFAGQVIATENSTIHARVGGSGPPLLLLHGFPETSLMWRNVAPLLAEDFTTVCPDLRGYGESGCPPSDDRHEPYSKRAMGRELISAMKALGFHRFAVGGHDRGGRIAYRMALDAPAIVTRLAVLDVIPIGDAWAMADSRLALAFWPWSLLAQPAPLPETLIGAAPHALLDDALSNWGTPAECFPPEVRQAYLRPFNDPARVHAICEEFRAAATIDREDDEADRVAGRKIMCPTLALWDSRGALETWYGKEGGPLAIWRRWVERVEGNAVEGGHFFPEARPRETAAELRTFFKEVSRTAS